MKRKNTVHEAPPRLAKSALARRLGITRPKLDAALSRPGAPEPDDAKTYDVGEVAGFCAAAEGSGLSELRAARLEEIQLRCEKLRRELATAAREVLSVAEVNAALHRVAVAEKGVLIQHLTYELPLKLAGLDAPAMIPIMRETIAAICQEMQALDRLLPVKLGGQAE